MSSLYRRNGTVVNFPIITDLRLNKGQAVTINGSGQAILVAAATNVDAFGVILNAEWDTINSVGRADVAPFQNTPGTVLVAVDAAVTAGLIKAGTPLALTATGTFSNTIGANAKCAVALETNTGGSELVEALIHKPGLAAGGY